MKALLAALTMVCGVQLPLLALQVLCLLSASDALLSGHAPNRALAPLMPATSVLNESLACQACKACMDANETGCRWGPCDHLSLCWCSDRFEECPTMINETVGDMPGTWHACEGNECDKGFKPPEAPAPEKVSGLGQQAGGQDWNGVGGGGEDWSAPSSNGGNGADGQAADEPSLEPDSEETRSYPSDAETVATEAAAADALTAAEAAMRAADEATQEAITAAEEEKDKKLDEPEFVTETNDAGEEVQVPNPDYPAVNHEDVQALVERAEALGVEMTPEQAEMALKRCGGSSAPRTGAGGSGGGRQGSSGANDGGGGAGGELDGGGESDSDGGEGGDGGGGGDTGGGGGGGGRGDGGGDGGLQGNGEQQGESEEPAALSEDVLKEAMIDVCATELDDTYCSSWTMQVGAGCTCNLAVCRDICASFPDLNFEFAAASALTTMKLAVKCLKGATHASTHEIEFALREFETVAGRGSAHDYLKKRCRGKPCPNNFNFDTCAGGGRLGPETGKSSKQTQLSGAQKTSLIAKHNELRAKHCSPDLMWSNGMAKLAQDYAKTCPCGPSAVQFRRGAGEIISWGYAKPEDAVEAWYMEEGDYVSYANGGSGSTSGVMQFRQLLWKSTIWFGCGYADGCMEPRGIGGATEVLVCYYSPAGSDIAQAATEVPRPQSNCPEPTYELGFPGTALCQPGAMLLKDKHTCETGLTGGRITDAGARAYSGSGHGAQVFEGNSVMGAYGCAVEECDGSECAGATRFNRGTTGETPATNAPVCVRYGARVQALANTSQGRTILSGNVTSHVHMRRRRVATKASSNLTMNGSAELNATRRTRRVDLRLR